MFGYRVKFDEDKMISYMKNGAPSIRANQEHKPIHFWTHHQLQQCTERYKKLNGYFTSKTIVRVLDSDNEDDILEIEKNKRIIKQNQRTGV